MFVQVFVKAELEKQVCNIEKTTVATGVAGVGGNKGGVAIKFEICETAVVFVCGHLAAHHGHTDQRNANYTYIRDRLLFSEIAGPTRSDVYQLVDHAPGMRHSSSGPLSAQSSTHPYLFRAGGFSSLLGKWWLGGFRPLLEHDLVVFFGDLNYRIDKHERCGSAANAATQLTFLNVWIAKFTGSRSYNFAHH
eukprot:SAG31_NODE_2875_length_4971_cov_2.727011_5_plen_192_part_00